MTVPMIYDGPHDRVDVKLPTRWLLGVDRGSVLEVTDEEARRLLDLPGWESAPSSHPEEDES